MRIPSTRQIVLGLLLAGASSLVTLLLGEGILRLAVTRVLSPDEPLHVGRILDREDPLLGFSLMPGSRDRIARGGAYFSSNRINSLGLRDDEQSLDRSPGLRRILVLGDSFMFGEGVAVEEALPRRIAQRMPRVEVFNAGVRAYDLGQEYLYYKHRGERFEEDLVLLAFYANDLGPEPYVVFEDGEDGLPVSYKLRPEKLRRYRETRPRGLTGAISSWLRDRSMLYVLVRNRLDNMRAAPRRGGGSLVGVPHPPLLRAFHAEPEGYVARDWERVYRILDALKDLCAERGSRLALILVPAPWQTSPAVWERWTRVRWVRAFGAEPESLSRFKPQEMVSDWCERTGTPCLDLSGEFERGVERELYFWPHDMHWNAEGHRVAADAVSAFLADRSLP